MHGHTNCCFVSDRYVNFIYFFIVIFGNFTAHRGLKHFSCFPKCLKMPALTLSSYLLPHLNSKSCDIICEVNLSLSGFHVKTGKRVLHQSDMQRGVM